MKRIYVDMDDVLCDFLKAYNEAQDKSPELKFPQSQLAFFENLERIEGAIESVNKLRESFDVYVLTAPSNRNPHCYTEKRLWIEKYFGYEFTEKLIICSNKSLLRGNYLIDDYAVGKGQENFEGKLIQFGSDEFPNWQKVMEYFKRSKLPSALNELAGCLQDIETERMINKPELGIEGKMCGFSPTQVEGTIQGHQFYFRYRWNTWSFYVSLNPGVEPHDIQLINEDGEEKCANDEGFYRSGVYHDGEYDNLEKIILKQAKLFNEWLQEKVEHDIVIRDHDTGETVEIEGGEREELARRMIDNDNPIRYVIASEISSDWRFFYNVDNSCYAQNIEGGTFFKSREQAEAVANLLEDKVIVKVIKKGDEIKILEF
jgi:5'-nucleotidase